MKESRSFSKSRGTCSCHLFVYLSIFSVNKCLLRTVNKVFCNLSLLKFFWHAEAVPQRWSPGEGCSADVLQIVGGLSVRGCDFNKVAKRLCCDRASALFSCGFASSFQSIILGEYLWKTASEQI